MLGDATSGQYSDRGEKSASPALPPLWVHETRPCESSLQGPSVINSQGLCSCVRLCQPAGSMSEGSWRRGLSPEHQYAREVAHRRVLCQAVSSLRGEMTFPGSHRY